MTWTEGVLCISDTFAIHGGYLGIVGFSIFVGTVGYMIGDTINEVCKDYKGYKD